MTEDEAKMKVCCGPEGCGYFNDTPRPARWCLGSGCMAWRWEKHITNKAEIQRTMQMMQAGSGYHQIDPEFANTNQGYCGLAGKP